MVKLKSNWVNYALAVAGVSMVLFQMVSTQILLVSSYQFQDIHLGFLLTLIFLATLKGKPSRLRTVIQLLLVLAGLVAAAYVYLNVKQLQLDAGFPNMTEFVFGIAIMALVIEATRQAWGSLLPIVALCAIGYYIFGSYIPGPFHHPVYSMGYIVSDLSIGLSGIYGTFLSISANMVFLFVVFGALLSITRITDLFFELGKVTGKAFRGGPAQTAVIASSLIGMVSGAAVANVATVGSFTIPYMKRVGYSPEMAGAIEANASTGGQIMPPVMGASAFLLATFVGVPYRTVMLAGIIPAFLFYWACMLGVQYYSVSKGLGDQREAVDWTLVRKRILLFVIPLAILIVLLFLRYSPSYAAFWAIIVSLALSYISKETRPSLPRLINAVTEGAVTGARIGITLAIVGIMAETLITTGLGNKLALMVQLLSGGHLFVALCLTMLVSLILGMGIPTTAAYSLVAVIVVPSLIAMHVEPLQAHFFAFYFAVVSALTPPVALASLTASGIAGGDYLKTSLNAFRLGIPAFVIPYLIVYNPEMLFTFAHPVSDVVSLVAIFGALTASTSFLFKCGIARLGLLEWMLTGAGSVALYAFAFANTTDLDRSFPIILLAIAIALLLWSLVLQLRRKKTLVTAVQ